MLGVALGLEDLHLGGAEITCMKIKILTNTNN
jgi:hypothetical protein